MFAYSFADSAACSGHNCDLSCQFLHTSLSFLPDPIAMRLICDGAGGSGFFAFSPLDVHAIRQDFTIHEYSSRSSSNSYLSQEAGGFYNPANRVAVTHTYGVMSSRRDSMQGCIVRRLALAEFLI